MCKILYRILITFIYEVNIYLSLLLLFNIDFFVASWDFILNIMAIMFTYLNILHCILKLK